MPWKACEVVELRRAFVERVEAGERVTDLCREYGISRTTGHNLLKRYELLGEAGLQDASRAPKRFRGGHQGRLRPPSLR